MNKKYTYVTLDNEFEALSKVLTLQNPFNINKVDFKVKISELLFIIYLQLDNCNLK